MKVELKTFPKKEYLHLHALQGWAYWSNGERVNEKMWQENIYENHRFAEIQFSTNYLQQTQKLLTENQSYHRLCPPAENKHAYRLSEVTWQVVKLCPQVLKAVEVSTFTWIKINALTWIYLIFLDISATMSSPTSTPGGRKRGRSSNPATRKLINRFLVLCLFVCLLLLTLSLCLVCPQPAARAPHHLPLSAAKARTPPPGTWCRCPPPRPPTCSVQQHLRTLLCSPALVPQVRTTGSVLGYNLFCFIKPYLVTSLFFF